MNPPTPSTAADTPQRNWLPEVQAVVAAPAPAPFRLREIHGRLNDQIISAIFELHQAEKDEDLTAWERQRICDRVLERMRYCRIEINVARHRYAKLIKERRAMRSRTRKEVSHA